MCGVIVVDAGRSRSTCHGRDAYIHGHCLGYHHNYALFYQLLNSNLFTHRMLSSREKPLVKPMAPGSIFYHIIFRSIKPKIQKYFAALYFICDLLFQSSKSFSRHHTISGIVTRKGLTTPLTRRVASICYLCAGADYVVLLGSPTGSITLVSSLREIPTVVVLHHPFLFGEIPT